MTSTVAAAPLAWIACSGSSSGQAATATDAGPDVVDAAVYPCEAEVTVLGLDPMACMVEVELPCGFDGALSEAGCAVACEPITGRDLCGVVSVEGGTAIIGCPCAGGRRPFELEAARRAPARGIDFVTAWLSDAALLEAASVDAFLELRFALKALGAPKRLRDACTRAARDERRHARSMTALGGALDGRIRRRRPLSTPSLEALAIHNAREGCVRETFGALIATVQGTRAAHPRMRRALRSIAVDETRHAALAWRIHAWAMTRLSPAARRRVVDATRAEEEALIRELAVTASIDVQSVLGVPPAAHAIALARGLHAARRTSAVAASSG